MRATFLNFLKIKTVILRRIKAKTSKTLFAKVPFEVTEKCWRKYELSRTVIMKSFLSSLFSKT
jgi:hypothetical protein